MSERQHCYIHGRAVNSCTPDCPAEGWTPAQPKAEPRAETLEKAEAILASESWNRAELRMRIALALESSEAARASAEKERDTSDRALTIAGQTIEAMRLEVAEITRQRDEAFQEVETMAVMMNEAYSKVTEIREESAALAQKAQELEAKLKECESR